MAIVKYIVGRYDRYGYRIYSYPGDVECYSAGNAPQDSQFLVTDGLPLRTIRSYCLHSTKEIALELKVNQYWIERNDDE